MTPVVVLSTVGADFDAAKLATRLIEARLAACVNITGVRSVYRWKGKVEDDREQLLVIKTTDERVPALKEALFAQHPYEVPEFVILPVDRIEGPYREWLLEAVSDAS